jgi:hypothetical protein
MKDDVNDEVPNGAPKILIPFDGVVNRDGVLKLGNKLKGDYVTPLNSLMDSTVNPKVKTTKGERIGVCFLACNISRVKGRVGAPRWGLGRLTSKLITHPDMHKPNKLVSA